MVDEPDAPGGHMAARSVIGRNAQTELSTNVCFLGAISQKVDELRIQILWTSMSFFMRNTDQSRPQFCTCHDSSAAVTCANLWPDSVATIMIKAKIIFMRLVWWAHKWLVKRFPEGHTYGLSWPLLFIIKIFVKICIVFTQKVTIRPGQHFACVTTTLLIHSIES